MENATKALLIAAAVLIVILLISLVMGVFNRGAEFTEGAADLSEYQVQQHNDKFRKFEGSNKSGSDVNALLTTVFNHNNAQPDTSTCVAVTGSATIAQSNTLTTSPTKVSTSARYTVTLTYDSTTKLVSSIAISTPTPE